MAKLKNRIAALLRKTDKIDVSNNEQKHAEDPQKSKSKKPEAQSDKAAQLACNERVINAARPVFLSPKEEADDLVEKHGSQPWKALAWAVENRQYRAVTLLLDQCVQDADPTIYYHCIAYAVEKKNNFLVSQLLNAAKLSQNLPVLLDNQSLLKILALNVGLAHLSMLLSGLDTKGKNRVLERAVEWKLPLLIPALINAGIDLNRGFDDHSILPKAIQDGDADIISLLLRLPEMDVNALGKTHREYPTLRRPIQTAARAGNQTLLQLLLRHNDIDVNAADLQESTALHAAAQADHTGIVKMLLENGADPVRRNKFGQQAIHVAGTAGNEASFNVLREWAGLKPVTPPLVKTTEHYSEHAKSSQRLGLEPSDPAYWN